ncbi:MAG: hypothetical protein J6A15_07430 [Clostridia bacterium]|nr:hypothetical protein [Clostridia bacterium]
MNISEQLSKLLLDLQDNTYRVAEKNDIDAERKFFDISKALEALIEKVYLEIDKNLKFEYKSQNIINNRKRFAQEIYDELENSYIPNGNGGDVIEFTTRFSYLTEMVNNAAHIVDIYVNENKKQSKEFKEIRNELFKIKNVSIEKIAKNAIGKEKDGVIIGMTEDTTKYENADVFVVDLPYKGQLSWHISTDKIMPKSIMSQVPKYKYRLEKGITDSKEKTLNSKLLLDYGSNNAHNIHNRIVKNIPYDNENELESALDIYYEVINNRDEYEAVESKLISACKKHKLLSQETFDMLLNEMMDTLYLDKDYDKKYLRDWRDKYENRRK